ncbi:GNAT family acetyltransferase [Mangrovimonas yunxiaonensis]|uniref:GNAT family acetyltransferase n=1 Tax=Mangrovimonas yunxiaonensis TaxID=1197477 RepID=A0A084TM88_9FLAO|nr:GNAT family N-acetyltransferase [Mangrovimonas yunxiaonensis]KFB01824.1 GNAT family acetyltransferase [Mangrovimonas yunxiaonensis]MBR9757424.1 GNAT family N-acetyltransferase [Algicola sp.]GGH41214.1 N-acetyltransferase [Mangrovimonas yunxiaonensis]
MTVFKIYNANTKPSKEEKDTIINFLHTHLQEFGDNKEDISKCLDYAVKDNISAHGGFVLVIKDKQGIQGITIINETGMGGYIPENILVYIAVHQEARGKGYGKQLMQKAITLAQGDIALHVEPNNPAIHLYEKLGFENKYLEMRLKK